MSKKLLVGIIAVIFAVVNISCLFAADDEEAGLKKPGMINYPQHPMSNFRMVSGTIEKIDPSDPANVKLEVKDKIDNTTHTILVSPATNITKVTDVSDLKVGEAVKVMEMIINDKETAMGIIYGKIENIPQPPHMASGMPPMNRPTAAYSEQEDTKK